MNIRLPDYAMQAAAFHSMPKIPHGVVAIGAELEWVETKGAGIKVAVLDTGTPQHADLRVVKSVSFTGDPDEYDHHGHATHVAGTICANGNLMGVAPDADLYTVKVLSNQGHGTDQGLTDGIHWCIEQGVDVINLSLGALGPMPKTHQAIIDAVAAGIIVICAAGNTGASGLSWPGRYPETIAVAAVDLYKERSPFSSDGDEVEVAALGTTVLSTWLGGGYTYLSGTSMACPHIAGAVALLQAKAKIRYGRKLTLPEVRVMLHMYAEDLGELGHDTHYGFGAFSFGRIAGIDNVPQDEVRLIIGLSEYYVNNERKLMDAIPRIENGRTMVPARFVAEGLGAEVSYIDGRGKQADQIVFKK